MNHLAENVRRLRKIKEWSQARLIDESGVTSVKRIEVGQIQSPRYPTLDALAKALGVQVADLYSVSDDAA